MQILSFQQKKKRKKKEENNTITANKIIAGLYIAAFERAPDQEGLIFWENEANNNIASGSSAENVYKDQIMKGFVTHPVFANTYNHLDNATFVDSIYQNILGQAGDSIGQAFWESTLNTGLSRSDMIVDFVQGTFEFNPTNPLFSELSTAEIQTANERQSLLNNKVEAALYFVDILKTNTYIFNNPPENDNAYLASIKVIEDITHDSSTLINAKAVIDLAKDETNPMTYIINQPSEALTRNKIFNNIENNELIGIVPVEDDLYFL